MKPSMPYTEHTVNLKKISTEKEHYYYDEFEKEPITITLLNALNPTERQYEKASYLIFEGYFKNPNTKSFFHFSKKTFLRKLKQVFDFDCIHENEQLEITLTIFKPTKKKLQLKLIDFKCY